ncbi:hypothetical protein [Defluviimonas sp. WL0075]|uniref:Uncharacterized protein n=1 Tax=Albidovulum sediminicola TaxID=2984331 RepID=A0ABT2Z703_9RHOB|nr:hypothetical protein [Defluviimonas sp. WL0075]MCV2866910.1 hypothetical protein [Defluviimonas sp. WL0075]
MAMFWRLWWAASATLAFAMLIFVGLTLLQFQNIQRTLLAERVAVLAVNTAEPFNAAAGIGIPLLSVRNAGALLERARQTDDAITSIHILDPQGRMLHQVGNEEAGADLPALPAGWQTGPVNLFGGNRFISFNPIAFSDGKAQAAMVISLDASPSVNRTWAMGAELATAAAAFLGVGATLIGIALRRAFAREIADFEGIERDVELFERDTWRGVVMEPGEGGELRRALNNAYASYRVASKNASTMGHRF